MLDELSMKKKVVGLKQTAKVIHDGLAVNVYVAKDADERVISPIIAACNEKGIKTFFVDTMRELGKAAGISIGAAVVATTE